jgi:two-component system OmpR family response regulator
VTISSTSQTANRLLLVDDNAHVRDELAAAFSKVGWEVAHAANGTVAIDLARLHQPVLVLTELVLPDMGGHQLARTIRSVVERQLLIIAITRIADNKIHAQARRGGFDDVFAKPVQLDPLFRRIAMGTGRLSRIDPNS